MVELALIFWLVVSSSADDGPWCDVVFKDVARTASVVVHAQVGGTSRTPELQVVDVIKGDYDKATVELASERLSSQRIRNGDHLFIALDDKLAPVDVVDGMGACLAVSVLRLRGGKLRSRERINYDYEQAPLSVDELLELLEQDLRPTAWAR